MLKSLFRFNILSHKPDFCDDFDFPKPPFALVKMSKIVTVLVPIISSLQPFGKGSAVHPARQLAQGNRMNKK